MYQFLLILHSWTRWIVLILGIFAIVSAFSGLSGNKQFTSSANKTSLFFMISMHVQLLIGLLLYFVYSPITAAAMADFGAAMKNGALRFWAVEHLALMLLAVVFATVGRITSKKATTDRLKFKKIAIFYTITLILVLISIPWPFMQQGRDLFRF